MAEMKLCNNCLETHSQRPIEVGPPKGGQRDSYRDSVSLCGLCSEALLEGDFAVLKTRYASERTIKQADYIVGSKPAADAYDHEKREWRYDPT